MFRRNGLRKVTLGAVAFALASTGLLALAPGFVGRAEAAGPATLPPGVVAPIGITSPGKALPGGFGSGTTVDGPRISVEGVAEVAPGGEIKLDGVNLGTALGRVCLTWTNVLVNNIFTQNSTLCLTNADWQPTRVIVDVPGEVTGVPDQTAHVVLTTADGQHSNSADIKFVATRELRKVSDCDPRTTQVCGLEAELDQCGWQSTDHWDGYVFSFGESGTDVLKVDLANGWTVDHLDFSVQDGSASVGQTPARGATAVFVTVNWSVGDFSTETKYSTGVWVFGPKGVPLN